MKLKVGMEEAGGVVEAEAVNKRLPIPDGQNLLFEYNYQNHPNEYRRRKKLVL